jgi:hypothetical protein
MGGNDVLISFASSSMACPAMDCDILDPAYFMQEAVDDAAKQESYY